MEDDAVPAIQGRLDLDHEPMVDWPATSKQVVERCGNPDVVRSDSNRSGKSSDSVNSMQRTSAWKRVHSLREIENLYDLGFWDNLWDILPSQ